MPEASEDEVFLEVIEKTKHEDEQCLKEPFQASLQIFPSAFAEGISKRDYTTATADYSLFDPSLEPIPCGSGHVLMEDPTGSMSFLKHFKNSITGVSSTLMTRAASISILEAMSTADNAEGRFFTLFGRHSINDALHHVELHPGMPAVEICVDDTLYEAFKAGLAEYMQQFCSAKFRRLMCNRLNTSNPSTFQAFLDARYPATYMTIFRKATVCISTVSRKGQDCFFVKPVLVLGSDDRRPHFDCLQYLEWGHHGCLVPFSSADVPSIMPPLLPTSYTAQLFSSIVPTYALSLMAILRLTPAHAINLMTVPSLAPAHAANLMAILSLAPLATNNNCLVPDCGVVFSKLETSPCPKCIKIDAVTSQAEKKLEADKSQCISCGVSYKNLSSPVCGYYALEVQPEGNYLIFLHNRAKVWTEDLASNQCLASKGGHPSTSGSGRLSTPKKTINAGLQKAHATRALQAELAIAKNRQRIDMISLSAHLYMLSGNKQTHIS
ncbi:hypothetical protein BDZ89DRAFT_1050434 [Hymenopellis radicata]|nr:hypothetical protein BDZ89DRAFT_1050434 [Hymenopellis radicata]